MLVYLFIFGVSVICAVLLLWYFDPLSEGFQVQGTSRSYTLMPNTDYPGLGDIGTFRGTITQSQAACDTTPGCTGFTYTGTTAYLKNILPTYAASTAASSFYVANIGTRSYVPLTNTDYPGQGDLFTVTGTLTQAQQACDTAPNCNGFSYNRSVATLKYILPSYTSTSSTSTMYVLVDPSTSAFWDLVAKVNKNDPTTMKNLAKVTDPDPNDLMPLTFSKYISLYAMAKFDNNLSAARNALYTNYNTLQNDLSTKVYSKSKWTDPKAESCANLEKARASFIMQYTGLVTSVQDLSGSALTAGKMHDENLAYQTANMANCQPPSPGCISLATQDGPVFSLMAKYETTNNTLLSGGAIDISNNLDVINSAYKLLKCGPFPNMFFKSYTSPDVYFISKNLGYKVNSCTGLCSDTAIAANCANPTLVPQSFFDSLSLAKNTGADICPIIRSTSDPTFSISDTGIIDTVTLTSKLNELSPYYVSPDTLNYITSSIISGSDIKSSLTTDSDKLSNITNVINTLKSITRTT